MAEPLGNGPGHNLPASWNRPYDQDRRRSWRWPRLDPIINRRALIAVTVLAALVIVGKLVEGEDHPPTDPAPTPADEAEALVAVRAAEARAGFGITVRVTDGTVILAGTVETPEARRSAELVAKSVVGTDFRIENQLLIGQNQGEPKDDTAPLTEVAEVAEVTEVELALQNKISSLLARDPITFTSGSAELTEGSLATLNALVAELRSTDIAVTIAGHTDSDGLAEDNLRLSKQRADTVLTYLANAGIDPSRLAAEGFGGSHPVSGNETRQDKAANRRIEVLVKRH